MSDEIIVMLHVWHKHLLEATSTHQRESLPAGRRCLDPALSWRNDIDDTKHFVHEFDGHYGPTYQLGSHKLQPISKYWDKTNN